MAEPILQLSGITKSFGALAANSDITLDLQAGEIHALIGPNGAGKSTLIKQISGELAPDRGRIALSGRDITDLGQPERVRLGLARTFQISALMTEFTALQNAVLAVAGGAGSPLGLFSRALGKRDLVASARTHLDAVGLAGRAEVPVGALSHGERRRLEVALALCLKPKLFLMDEPMAGLGAEGTRDLTILLSDLRQVAPILLVEHDMDAVFQLADRISVLVNGTIIATGTPGDIRENASVREAYLGDEEVP